MMAIKTTLIVLVEQKLECGDVELPVIDNIASRVTREINEGKLNAEELSKIIEKDPVLIADVLRMSNSSFYVGLEEVKSLREAIVRLGVKQIASLVFSSAQKRLYSASTGHFRGRMLQLWQHASAVSVTSRWLAQNSGHRALCEEAFVAGMLHDIGKLSLLRVIEDVVACQECDAESQEVNSIFMELHAAHGVKLLEKWNMPSVLRDVVLHVDEPDYRGDEVLVAIVRLADRICIDQGIGVPAAVELDLSVMPELATLHISEDDLIGLRELLYDFHTG